MQISDKAKWMGLAAACLLLAILAGGLALADGPAGRPEVSGQPGGRVSRSDLEGVVVEVALPEFEVSGQVACQLIEVAGWGQTARPGEPQLPLYGTMVGVPPGATVEVKVLDADQALLPGRYDICPAPTAVVDPGSPGPDGDESYAPPHLVGRELVEDATVYATNAFYPARLAEVTDDGFIRQQRYVRLAVRPFQYNPVSGQVRAYRHLRIELRFTYPHGQPPALTDAVEPGGFEQILQSALLNYDTARQWRAARASQPQGDWPAQLEQGEWYRIAVTQDAVYRVTYADLGSAGLPVDTLDPRTLRLLNGGSEVAIRVEGEEDGVFQPGDYILFYGVKIDDSKYTRANVYWLTYGQANGLRMAERDGSLSGGAAVPTSSGDPKRAEQNIWYTSGFTGTDETERWIWDWIYAAAPAFKTYQIALANPAAEPYTATLRAQLYGNVDNVLNPDHHTRLYVNNNLVEDAWWDGIVWRLSEVTFPSSYLIAGQNAIKVECPNDTGVGYDLVYIDWFEIEYRRTFAAESDLLSFGGDQAGTWEYRVTGFTTSTVEAFDIGDPLAVARIVSTTIEADGGSYRLRFEDSTAGPTRYLAETTARYSPSPTIVRDTPSDLSNPGNGADYIIITHRNFYTDVLPLAAYRESQGLRVAVADVQDVYDEFSYGVLTPAAIELFLRYAYDNWSPPAPSYVLLVGDGTADFKDYRNTGRKTYIPPRLAYVDPYVGEVDADNRYVCASGDDIWPDMNLGRLPAVTSAEAQGMVQKALNYENTAPGDWSRRLAFAADNVPDEAGDFVGRSNELIADHTPIEYITDTIYINDYCGPPGNPPVPCPAATAALVSAINGGRLWVNYVGHGMVNKWAAEGLWDLSALNSLNNAVTPIMLAMTCDEGAFANPYSGLNSIGANAVRIVGKGAVASWSPTGQGSVAGHHLMNTAFYDAVFQDGIRELGPATLAGKLNLYLDGGEDYLVDTFILFGDPALHIKALDTDIKVTKTVEPAGDLRPGDLLTYTLAFTNAGPATAFHVVLTDVIPALLVDPAVVYAGPAVISQTAGITFAWTITDLLPGDSGAIQVRAMVDPAAVSGTVVLNQAQIATTVPDLDPANNVASVTTAIYISVADLQVTKVVEPAGPVQSGDLLTYTLTFTNAGPATAFHVVLTDVIPTLLVDPVVVYASPAVISQTAGITFAWTITDLLPGDSGAIQVQAIVDPAAVSGTVALNQAQIASTTPDLVPANNVASVTTTICIAVTDLQVLKTVEPAGPVQPGDLLTYTLTFANAGPATASHVVLTDVIPTLLVDPVVVYASPAVISQTTGITFAWAIADLLPGDSGAIQVQAMVDPATVSGTVILNQAQITTTISDSDPANNVASVTTTVYSLGADLQVTKTVEPAGDLRPGDLLTYTLAFTNAGPATAFYVVLTDVIPALLVDPVVVYASPAVISQTAGITFAWTITDLLPGDSGVIQIRALIQAGAEPGSVVTNQVAIACHTLDPDLLNNVAAAITGIEAARFKVYLPLALKAYP